MTTRSDASYVKWYVRRHWEFAYGRGARWWFDKFVPTIERLERAARTEDERASVAKAWARWGMIHNLHGAFRTAVRCLKRSVEVGPARDTNDQWFWLGDSHKELGQYRSAVRAFRLGDKARPGEICAAELEDLQKEMANEDAPEELDEHDLEIQEALARDRPRRVLRLLGRKDDVSSMMTRAQAFGLLEDHDEVLNVWHRIAEACERVYLANSDWFYTPRRVLQGSELWRLLLRIEEDGRIEPSCLPCPNHDELMQDLPPPVPKHRREEWKHRYYLAVLRFQLADSERDVATLLEIAREFPNWSAPARSARALSLST